MQRWTVAAMLVGMFAVAGAGSYGYGQLSDCDGCDCDNWDADGPFCACVIGGGGGGTGCHIHDRTHCDFYGSCDPEEQQKPIGMSGSLGVPSSRVLGAHDRIVRRPCDGAVVRRMLTAQTLKHLSRAAQVLRV